MSDHLEYSILLKHLKLTNFRCFGDLDIDFDKKLTVFIAENGGGKTAILDAVAEGLRAYLASFKQKGYEKCNLVSKDIRNGSQSSDISIEAVASHIWQEEVLTEELKTGADNWDSKTDHVRFDVALRTEESRFVHDDSTSFSRDAKYFKNIYKIADLPVLVYYGGDSVAVFYDSKVETSTSRLDVLYKDALVPSRFSFTPFFNWYKENEDKMFRIRDVEDPEYKTIDNQLKKIKNAIGFILNDDINDPVYSDLRLNKNLQMGMTKKQPDGGARFVEISQFSAGEKALFAFVADLGLRLLQARFDQDFTETEGVNTIRGRGIVLIDEVDLHLHPKWQRKVVGKLMDIFPDVQWVMTTHSPLMLGGIPSKHVLRLNNGNVEKIEDTYGREIDDILSIVMAIDPGNFTNKVKIIASLIAENKLADAEREIIEVEQKINIKGDNGSEHPDILRMRSLLTRKKLIGK
jgi:predicted ATP-binding protein involved in virulence